MIRGKTLAKIENGFLISAEINLKENNSSLSTSISKFIIYSSGEKLIGFKAYEKGEPITSLNMKTSSNIYFVCCIVFSSNGRSNEIVSNSMTTSGKIMKLFMFMLMVKVVHQTRLIVYVLKEDFLMEVEQKQDTVIMIVRRFQEQVKALLQLHLSNCCSDDSLNKCPGGFGENSL